MNPALGCLRPRDLTGAMAGLVALAVVGFGIGLIASGTDLYDRHVPGLAAMTFAVPFGAVGWIAGIYAPERLVGPFSWGSGFVVAIGSMVVCDAVLAARRSTAT